MNWGRSSRLGAERVSVGSWATIDHEYLREVFFAKIVQTECNEACFNC